MATASSASASLRAAFLGATTRATLKNKNHNGLSLLNYFLTQTKTQPRQVKDKVSHEPRAENHPEPTRREPTNFQCASLLIGRGRRNSSAREKLIDECGFPLPLHSALLHSFLARAQTLPFLPSHWTAVPTSTPCHFSGN